MATTDILQFAGSGGANVLSQAAYAALTGTLADGYPSGILTSVLLNKTLRQAVFMAAGLATFCVGQGISVPDDGNLSNLVTELGEAFTAYAVSSGSVGNLAGQVGFAANAAVPASDFGNLIIANAASGSFTLTLPTPVANPGKLFWVTNISGHALNLSTPAGTFAILGSGTNSQSIPNGATALVVSDNGNYEVVYLSTAFDAAGSAATAQTAAESFATSAVSAAVANIATPRDLGSTVLVESASTFTFGTNYAGSAIPSPGPFSGTWNCGGAITLGGGFFGYTFTRIT